MRNIGPKESTPIEQIAETQDNKEVAVFSSLSYQQLESLSSLRNIKMTNWNGYCQRCGKETNCHSMSFLNEQLCCMECLDEEKDHPKFQQAKAEELRQVQAGNLNYNGLLHGNS